MCCCGMRLRCTQPKRQRRMTYQNLLSPFCLATATEFTPSQRDMAESSATHGSTGRCGLDKRKACVFLILVAVGLLCIFTLAYLLFFATPHANTPIKNGGHSLLQEETSPSPALVSASVSCPLVNSGGSFSNIERCP